MSEESTPGPVSPPDSFSRQAAQADDSKRSSDTSFSQSDTASGHMVVLRSQHRSKSKVKVFQCTGYDDCNMTFSRSEHLARHIRKHTGERPFVCFCGRSFSRLDNLRQHVYTVHVKEGHIVQSNGTTIAMGSKSRRAAFDTLQQQQQQHHQPPQQQPQQPAMVSSQPQPHPFYQPTAALDTHMGGTTNNGQKPLPPHPTMVMPVAPSMAAPDVSSQYHPAPQTTAGGMPMMMMMGGTMIGQPMMQQPVPAPGYTYATIPGQGLVQVPAQAAVGGQAQPQPQVYFQAQPTVATATPSAPSHTAYPTWSAAANSNGQLPPSRPQSTDALSAYSYGSNAPPGSPLSTSSALDGASPLRVPSSFSNRQSRDRYSVSSVDSSGRLSVASASSVRSSQTSLWLSSVLNDSNESPPMANPHLFEPDSNSLPAVSQLGPLKPSTYGTDLSTKPLPKLPFEMSNGSDN